MHHAGKKIVAVAALLAAGFFAAYLRFKPYLGREAVYTDGEQVYATTADERLRYAVWEAPRRCSAAVNSPGPEGRPALSPDGRWLVFAAGEPGLNADLYVAEMVQGEARPAQPLAGANTPFDELAPAFAGELLYFASNRPGGAGGFDLYRAAWRDGAAGAASALPAPVNGPADDLDATLDPESGVLVFASNRGKALPDDHDLYLAEPAATAAAEDGYELQALASLNSGYAEREPAFAGAARSLFFASDRPGGAGGFDLYRSLREQGGWLPPEPLPGLNSPQAERGPCPSADGFTLYFSGADPPGDFDLYQARSRELLRVPGRPVGWLDLAILATLLLLALLAWLAQRWERLDVLYKCLLVSLVVHLLLLWWFRRVHPEPGPVRLPERTATFQVMLDLDRSAAAERNRQRGGVLDEPSREEAAEEAGGPQRRAPEQHPAQAHGAPEFQEMALTESSLPAAPAARPQPVPPPGDLAGPARDRLPEAALQQPAPAGPLYRETAVAAETPLPGADFTPFVLSTAAAAGVTRSRVTVPAASSPAAAREPARPGLMRAQAAASEAAESSAAARPAAAEFAPPEHAQREVALPSPAASSGDAVPLFEAAGPAQPSALEPRAVFADRSTGEAGAAPLRRDPGAGTSPLARGRQEGLPAPAALAPARERQEDLLAGRTAASPAASGGTDWPERTGTGTAPVAVRVADPAEEETWIGPAFTPSGAGLELEAASWTPDAAQARQQPRAAPERADLSGVPDLAPREPPTRAVQALARAGAEPASERPPDRLHDTPYRSRFGTEKEIALRSYGGSAETEAAVERGLAYLAAIQHGDGYWGSAADYHEKYGHVAIGKTGLALLAFLGAGHTPASNSRYSATVGRALRFLVEVQDEASGHFGDASAYSHGIASYALAECYALTQAAELRAPLLEAVGQILRQQQRDRDPRFYGGWGYYKAGGSHFDRWPRASITSWQVMALESARLGGLEVPDQAFAAARAFLLRSFDEEHGWFRYSHDPQRLNSAYPTLPGSTPAALFALSLLGEDLEHEGYAAAREFVLDRAPERYARASEADFVHRARGNLYFWYYGTLAMFRCGGPAWEQWNQRMKQVLLDGQEQDGSWRPICVYAEYAGDDDQDRSYTTALCVLSLEIYYRYFTPLLRADWK